MLAFFFIKLNLDVLKENFPQLLRRVSVVAFAAKGWLWRQEFGVCVRFTPPGPELFACWQRRVGNSVSTSRSSCPTARSWSR